MLLAHDANIPIRAQRPGSVFGRGDYRDAQLGDVQITQGTESAELRGNGAGQLIVGQNPTAGECQSDAREGRGLLIAPITQRGWSTRRLRATHK